MKCTVRELLARIDSKELSEWQAIEIIEPLDYDIRRDTQQAMIACILANSNRGKRPPFKIEDFMQVRPQRKQQTSMDMKMMLKAFSG